MDPQTFISEKHLSFVSGSVDSAPFWGGGDSFEEFTYELFVNAGASGPTQKQIDAYESFYAGLSESFKSLEAAIRDWLRENDPAEADKFQHKFPKVVFVTIGGNLDNYEIMVTMELSRGVLFFGKSYGFHVKLRDNSIMEIEVFG